MHILSGTHSSDCADYFDVYILFLYMYYFFMIFMTYNYSDDVYVDVLHKI